MSNYLHQQYTCPNQREVNAFYKRQGQNVSCHSADDIYTITIRNTHSIQSLISIIAAAFVRKIPTNNEPIYLLRSVYVAPEHRRQGLAQSLIQYIQQNNTVRQTIICSPELISFYQKLGFVQPQQNKNSSILFLNKRLTRGKKVLIFENGSNQN